MSRLLLALLFAVCLASLGLASGCNSTSTGVLPVDSPLVEFVAPETDELIPDESGEDDEEDDEDDEDFLDEAGDNTTPSAGADTPASAN